MTVIFSKKCEYGLQAVLYLATFETGAVVSADDIAKKLSIPKEFVSKILQSLTESGIIISKKGKSGGFLLGRDPKKIKLIDIVAAIDGLEMFNSCVLGFPNCNPTNPCPLHEKWGVLRTQTYNMLNEDTIDSFKRKNFEKGFRYLKYFFNCKSDYNNPVKTKKKIIRNHDKPIQKYRFYIQTAFALLCIWIGIEMFLFIQYLESGGTINFSNRPPGVDGFLPISSMMSFYLFITTGELHQAHPAGVFIFMGIILMSLTVGKSFCSWLCPVGFISELIGDFGQKIFKKKIKLPNYLDYFFRSFKYLMLGFLFYAVFFLMTTVAVKSFLDNPYNLVSDIKMYYFFADISRFALIIIGILFLLSIPFKSFWCRYLCPYGALLGILNFLSPTRIKRNPLSCTDCGLCSKACPSFIKVDKVKTVLSDECTSCFSCIDVCPVADTLELKPVFSAKKKINKRYAAIGLVSIFIIVTGIGMLTGNWDNKISKEEYLIHYKKMDTYGHPTGTEAVKKFNEESNTKLNVQQGKK